jgi:hypothetical protein
MASFQKYKVGQANTIVGTQTTAGTLYGVNTNLHVITVKNSKAFIGNVIPECGQTGGVVEAVVNEVNPLAYFVTNSTIANQANIFVVTDVTVKAGDIQHRVRQIGANSAATTSNNLTFTYANTAVGPNQVDISGAVVTSGTSFTVL